MAVFWHTEAEDYPFYDQTFAVQFESSQAKGPRMRQIVHDQIRQFIEEGISEDDAEYYLLVLKQEHQKAFAEKNVAYWTENLQFYNRTHTQLDDPRYFDGIIDQIRAKDIVAFARKFFDTAQCIDVVIY